MPKPMNRHEYFKEAHLSLTTLLFVNFRERKSSHTEKNEIINMACVLNGRGYCRIFMLEKLNMRRAL